MNTGAISIEEWEHSKENILPVKSGRKANALSRAFGQAAAPNSLENERSQYKERIEMESQEEAGDPLPVWLEYINWAKESFPSSRAEQLALVQSATKLFRNDERYQQDERYLRLWILYADMLTNPIEMFQYLENKSIGSDWALFYEARAIAQESMGKYKDADESFQLGINRKAFPVERLKQGFSLFTERMQERVKVLKKQREEREQEREGRRGERSSRSSRGSERKALSKIGTSSSQTNTLSYSTMPVVPLQNENNRIMSVLQDDKSAPLPVNDIKVKWDNFSTEKESMKENILAAGAWTGKTLPQKRSRKPVTSGFSIYIDPECNEELSPTNDNANDSPEMEDVAVMKMLADLKKRMQRE